MVTLSSSDAGQGSRTGRSTWSCGRGARWLAAQQHYGENIGDTDSQAIFVELKDIGPTTATGIGESRLGPQPRE